MNRREMADSLTRDLVSSLAEVVRLGRGGLDRAGLTEDEIDGVLISALGSVLGYTMGAVVAKLNGLPPDQAARSADYYLCVEDMQKAVGKILRDRIKLGSDIRVELGD